MDPGFITLMRKLAPDLTDEITRRALILERIAAVVSLLSLSLSLTLSFSLLYVSGAGFYLTVFCLFSLLSHPL